MSQNANNRKSHWIKVFIAGGALLVSAACNSQGSDDQLWIVCVQANSSNPYKISDIFDNTKQRGSATIERNGDTIIVRTAEDDSLQRRTIENAFEFRISDQPSTSQYCGPMTARLARVTLEGRLVPEREVNQVRAQQSQAASRSEEGMRRGPEGFKELEKALGVPR